MTLLNGNTTQGKLVSLVTAFATLSSVSAPARALQPATPPTTPQSQLDNQNVRPERFGEASILLGDKGAHSDRVFVARTANSNELAIEPTFALVERETPSADSLLQGPGRTLIHSVSKEGEINTFTLKAITGLPGDRATAVEAVRSAAAQQSSNFDYLTARVEAYPIIAGMVDVIDMENDAVFGKVMIPGMRGKECVDIKLKVSDTLRDSFLSSLDAGRVGFSWVTNSRENRVAWSTLTQDAVATLTRAVDTNLTAQQKQGESLISLRQIAATCDQMQIDQRNLIVGNSSELLTKLFSQVLSPQEIAQQIFTLDRTALENLGPAERSALAAVLSPQGRASTTEDSKAKENLSQNATEISAQLLGKVGGKKGSVEAGLAGGRSSADAELTREGNATREQILQQIGSLEIFRFNKAAAATKMKAVTEAVLLAARGEMQRWPVVPQQRTEASVIEALKKQAFRGQEWIQAHMPTFEVRHLSASVVGNETRREHKTIAVQEHKETSKWGSDSGKTVTGRFDAPEGWTIEGQSLEFFKVLGERDVAGSIIRDGNGYAYKFNLKHGPWFDKWRHVGGIRGSISVGRDVQVEVRRDLAPNGGVKFRVGESAALATVPAALFQGLPDGRVAVSFVARDSAGIEELVQTSVTRGGNTVVGNFKLALIGDQLLVTNEKRVGQ